MATEAEREHACMETVELTTYCEWMEAGNGDAHGTLDLDKQDILIGCVGEDAQRKERRKSQQRLGQKEI